MPIISPEVQELYIKQGGVKCPFCHSQNITSGRIEAEGSSAWAVVRCEVCDEQWMDVYQLMGATTEEMDYNL